MQLLKLTLKPSRFPGPGMLWQQICMLEFIEFSPLQAIRGLIEAAFAGDVRADWEMAGVRLEHVAALSWWRCEHQLSLLRHLLAMALARGESDLKELTKIIEVLRDPVLMVHAVAALVEFEDSSLPLRHLADIDRHWCDGNGPNPLLCIDQSRWRELLVQTDNESFSGSVVEKVYAQAGKIAVINIIGSVGDDDALPLLEYILDHRPAHPEDRKHASKARERILSRLH